MAPPDRQQPRQVAFILMPGFALTSFALAVETLSVANSLSDRTLYEYTLYSGDTDRRSARVHSSNHVPIHTSAHFGDCGICDTLVVCAHRNAAQYGDERLGDLLRKQQRRGGRIAALSNGSLVLAKAGILGSRGCTLVGDDVAVFAELYPDIPVLQHLYTADGNVLTCAGGTSALDMFLYIVGRDLGQDTATEVSQRFLQDRIRSREEIQNAQRSLRLRMRSPHLGAAIELMEAHVEKPFRIDGLARAVGTTPRTLEHLFRRFENTTPARYYLDLRLRQARKMIEETRLPIATVAYSTGFSSQSYFSKRFRAAYGVQPRQLRSTENDQQFSDSL